MRDPFDAQPNLATSGRQLLPEFEPPATTVPPSRVYMIGNGDPGYWNPSSDSIVSHQPQRDSGAVKIRDEVSNFPMDPELTELLSRSRSQEEQIVMLRKQIADACALELQLLKEKHVLERRLSDIRMALDEKQDDAISEALKELTHKKGYIEENIRLAHDLQIAEEEVYIFTSSLLSLLAEYNIRLPLLNASTIASSTKRLYLNIDWKIRSSDASLDQRKHLLGNQPGDVTPSADRQSLKFSNNQLSQPHLDSRTNVFHQYNHVDPRVEPTPNQSRFIQDYGMMDGKGVNPPSNLNRPYREFPPNNYKDNTSEAINRRETIDDQFYIPTPHERQASIGSEGEIPLPGIEGFQIIGEARPGNTLRACGYPTNGTSLCIFQWVRHLENGTRQSIEGATVPEYVVTADDVDTFLAVDCIPMDDNGRQGELVGLFANSKNKITCDPDTQHEIDTHIIAGSAIFTLFLLMDSPEAWEQAILILKRTGYQVKINNTDVVVAEEKYSPELYIKVPNGQSNQFVLICSDGSTLPFNTSGITHNAEEDIRLRDIVVLTLRYFQSKAIDGKRKGKA